MSIFISGWLAKRLDVLTCGMYDEFDDDDEDEEGEYGES